MYTRFLMSSSLMTKDFYKEYCMINFDVIFKILKARKVIAIDQGTKLQENSARP